MSNLHISWAIEIHCWGLVFLEYISVAAVTAAGGFAFTASHLEKPQVTKGSCPAIRCLAWARHALTPALLRGPAAIGHPWPGAATAASLPRCPLRNACVRPLGKEQADQDQKPKQRQRQRQRQRQDQQLRGQASLLQGPVYSGASHHSTGRALARLQLLILMHRHLERPSGGSAQWATRHGCRVSRARPGMADRGGPTEQDRSEGMPSPGEAPNDRGRSALVTFALFESDPPSGRNPKWPLTQKRICTPPSNSESCIDTHSHRGQASSHKISLPHGIMFYPASNHSNHCTGKKFKNSKLWA